MHPIEFIIPEGFTMIRVLVVDDQKMIRENLKALLESEFDLQVVGTAEDGYGAITQVKDLQPDIVLIDVEMPGLDGIRAAEIISHCFTGTRVLVISGCDNPRYVFASLAAGAKGYILKNTTAQELGIAIRCVHSGYTQIGPGLFEKIIPELSQPGLSAVDRFTDGSTALMVAEKPALELGVSVQNSNGSTLDKNGSTPHTTAEIVHPVPTLGEFPKLPVETPAPRKKWPVLVIAAIGLAAGTAYLYTVVRPHFAAHNPTSVSTNATDQPSTVTRNVSALGRLEPAGEIIRLSAPNSLEGSRVDRLLVKEGDPIRAGQVLAILDTQASRFATFKKAQSDVKLAQARLAKVLQGAKQGDINAQRATIQRTIAELNGGIATQQAGIARIEAELSNAEVEYRRYEQLQQEGAISKSELDTRELRLKTVQKQLSEAQAALTRFMTTTEAQKSEAKEMLKSLEEVRPVDVQMARAELDGAIASAKQAQSNLDLTYIRAPINGSVIKVHAHPGEVVDRDGIAELGQTTQMYVVAEVYETDVTRVRLGQPAIVTTDALPGQQLRGSVAKIGLQVKKQNIFDVNPTANTDYKVVEVKIRLNPASSRVVAGFSNLQVQAVIQTDKS
jgi:HlyD family secretion protein